MNDIRITLKAARVNAGLTQKEAAKKANIAITALRAWEKDKTIPTPFNLMRLCALYGVSVDNIDLPARGLSFSG